jgi:F-type H+-transporting ATPase subunit delta
LAGQTENLDISRRYAHAVFALAREHNHLEPLSADLRDLQSMLAESEDLRKFIGNAALKRSDQVKALEALGNRAKWGVLTRKFIGTLAQKRRLNMLPAIIDAVLAEIAVQKGEVTAEVTAAYPLDARQVENIAAALKKALGKTVIVQLRQDASIMGGLIIKVGSKLIDSSVQSKLERLHRALKSSNTSQGQKKIREVA